MSTHTLIQSSLTPGKGPSTKRTGLIVGLVIAVLGLVYIALGLFTGRIVGPGASVGGVDIGGLSADEAQSTLEKEIGPRAAARIDLESGPVDAKLDPEKAGLSFDAEATVGQVTGFTLNPAIIADRLFGDDVIDPVITVDQDEFDAASVDATKTLAVKAKNASVTYSKTTPEMTAAVTGRSVDSDQLLEAVESKWLRGDDPIQVAATTKEPDITTDEAEAVRKGVAAEAVSEERTITAKAAADAGDEVKSGELTVTPKAIAKTLTFEPKDSDLVPVFDAKELRTRVLKANTEVGTPAKDASFDFVDGKPQVVPSKSGIGVSAKELSAAVLDSIADGDDSASVTLTEVDPDFTTAEAKKLDLSDTVSEFATSYNSSPSRDNNLRVASKTVSGTVVQPGEQFSLNNALGERTAASGYKPAGVISMGQMKEDFGGGVSQVSTTLFNAAFFAGFDLDEHQNHSRWISKYPEGRETTLDWTSIDLKFTNTSATPVVIDMYLAGGEVHAKMYGVKTLDVNASASGRFAFTSPSTIKESGPSCTPQAPKEGWSITITRTMKDIATGKTDKDGFTTVYRPVNRVECGK